MSVTVEVVESEQIVVRGVRRVRWRLRHGAGWTNAASVSGARVAVLASGPGVVWQRRIELDLPVGALLEREVTSPAEARGEDVLAHLSRARRSAAQHVAMTRYLVRSDGRLEREPQR